jgi:hypothetical protein
VTKYQIDNDGVSKSAIVDGERRLIRITSTRVEVVSTTRDLATDVCYVHLEARVRGRTVAVPVARALLKTTRDVIATLAPLGIAVDATNARELIRYLSWSEEQCAREGAPVATRTGWLADGRFALGSRLLLSAREEESLCADGDAPSSVCTSGDFASWLRVCEIACGRPKLEAAIYASLAAPALAHLSARNFIVDFAGETSTGKSTALAMASSCWGRPGDYDRTWDATPVWIERTAEALQDLPLLLDDTKRARGPKTVARVVYDVSDGRGRGRGSIGGVRRTATYRTVLISTGEHPLTFFTRDGGTRARVLEIWGVPMGETSPRAGQLAKEIDRVTRVHHGHAGERWIRQLQERDAERDRDACLRYEAAYAQKCADKISGRLCQHLGVLRFVESATAEWLGLSGRAIDELASDVLVAHVERDVYLEIARDLESWIAGNPHRFYRQGCDRVPTQGYCGAAGDDRTWWLTEALKNAIRDRGHEPKSVISLWRSRGYLGKGSTRRIERGTHWLIPFRVDAQQEEDAEEAEIPDFDSDPFNGV